MNLAPPKNPNYAATIVRVTKVNELPGLDNLVGIPTLGYQALTTRDVEEGDLMVVFTAETQLSPSMASYNNLFRHVELNVEPNPDKPGYLEDNARIRAIRLRGNVSNALILKLDSLSWTDVDLTQLKEGDTFDELNGFEICKKYVVREPRVKGQQAASAKVVRVDERQFPKHFDTENLFRNAALLRNGDPVVITQKLHGTSVRVGHVQVQRKLSWLEKGIVWAQGKFTKLRGLVSVRETEYAYVYGSRNVVKDPDNPFEQNHYYGTDLHTEVGQRLKGLLPKGFVVYAEIVGWTGNRPIQPDYTYGLAQGESELYVYRVARVGEDGRMVDLSWDQVREFCDQIDVKHVPEMDRIVWYAGKEEDIRLYLDLRFADDGYLWRDTPVPVAEGLVDEGVCVRQEGLTPLILKAKSPVFLEHETKQLDKGEVDIEEDERGELVAA